MLVGEAYGEHEEREQRPFAGSSGWLLRGMLSQVGISYDECYVTNVFNLRPKPGNDIKNICGAKADGIPGLPALQKGKHVLARYSPELDRLFEEITREQPNLIIALGATPAWALLRSSGIKAVRGATIPTHPAVSERL